MIKKNFARAAINPFYRLGKIFFTIAAVKNLFFSPDASFNRF